MRALPSPHSTSQDRPRRRFVFAARRPTLSRGFPSNPPRGPSRTGGGIHHFADPSNMVPHLWYWLTVAAALVVVGVVTWMLAEVKP